MKKFLTVLASLLWGFSYAYAYAQTVTATATAAPTPPVPLMAAPALSPAPGVAAPVAPVPAAAPPVQATPQPSTIITLKDGTKLDVQSDNTVWVINPDGSKVTAPDGMMLMRNGLTLVVKNGKQVPYE